jgi:hypothetical protein
LDILQKIIRRYGNNLQRINFKKFGNLLDQLDGDFAFTLVFGVSGFTDPDMFSDFKCLLIAQFSE